MRVGILTIVAVALAGVGIYLLTGYGEDDRGSLWTKDHLRVIQERLGILKSYLVEYKKAHNRYPTNDEGLAAIDFDSRFKVRLDLSWGQDGDFPDAGRFAEDLHRDQGMLQLYRAEYGHPPRDAEEFRRWALGGFFRRDAVGPAVEFEAAIGNDDDLFLLNNGQVLSPWLTPFGYENRSGLPAEAFADSPANRDKKGRYSVRVDDGVYVYCFGAEELIKEDDRTWNLTWARLLGCVLLVVAAAVLIVAIVPKSLPVLLGLGATILAILGFGVITSPRATCYLPAPLFSRRPAQMVARQRELLDKYLAAGVISKATHSKAVAALGPFTSTTAPADAD